MIYYSYNGERYKNHPPSVNNHYLTTLGNIENKILAVGDGGNNNEGNNKVELFDINSNSWTTKTSFPFSSTQICCYGTVSRESSVLIIGGWIDGSETSLIAKYTVDKWERIGNLQDKRHAHRAIINDNRIYVVGGRHRRL